MGKNTIANQKKKLAKAMKKKAKLSLELLTIPELLARAQEEIDTYQFENAQKYCQEALKREPDHILALETSASLCIEVGNIDGARHCLGRAITLQPNEGYSKYLSMAQLMEGKESFQCYMKGAELIQKSISNLQQSQSSESAVSKSNETTESTDEVEMSNDGKDGRSKEESEERENVPPTASTSSSSEPQDLKSTLVRQMSSAYCSVAELFMTDLCDEEDAEHQCQSHIHRAIEADPSNPEAYQNLASFLLVKQEMEQAKESITKSLELWLPKYKAVTKGEAAAGTYDPVEVCPLSFSTRLSTARILIEVEDYDNAVDVLEGLTDEDDTVVDTWYLLGWSCYLRGEDHRDNARDYLHRAMQAHKIEPCNDEELIEHLEELLTELGPVPEDDELDDDANIEDELGDSGEENEDQEMDVN